MAKKIKEMSDLRIFTGNSNPELIKKICKYLSIPLSSSTVGKFADGEIEVKLGESVRGMDVFIVQSTNPPLENLFELLLMIDASRRASARRITAVIPYFGYSRQDKKDEPRVPISSKLIANLISTAGANRILAMDLHAGQIQGFFDIPVDHLYSTPVLVEHFKKMKIKNLVIVSPDVGGAKRAEAIARRMGNLPLTIINKRRPAPDKTYITNVVGDVKNKNVLIVDDIISTGGTIVNAAASLKREGAKDIYCYCTHPLLAKDALQKIENSKLKKLLVANTIPLKKSSKKIEILSVSELLGEAISRIHEETSVTSLFV